MNVKIQHSLVSFAAIAIALIALLAMIQPAVAADANTLRLYGEDGYSAAFPYNDPEGPFDPLSYDAPMKDFVTFNPALMEDRIVVDQVDSKQKVFVRQWFVPELYEPVGEVWLEEPNMYVSEDVVTEYTYMFVDKHYEPVEGTVYSPTGALWTKFWFPVADNSDDQIGLDGFDINGDGVDDMTNLFAVGDFNADGRKDVALASDTYKLAIGEELQFLDHKIVVEDLGVISNDPAISIVVDVYYTGNDEDELIADNYMATILPGEFLSAGRHTVIKDTPTFTEPWFLEAEAVGSDSVYVRVGRLLHTGETFFVDAAEYDVAMIFGTYPDSVKYITIRNPVPEHYDINLEDLSVIKLSVADCEYVPLLPPLNMVHTMVDDINIPEYADHYTTCFYPNSDDNTQYIDYRYDTVEERKIYDVAPLKIYFTGKDIEPRFHTDLLEILDEDCVEGEESWDWLHIRTMPDFYKDFVYPALPDIDDGYGDFIVTSSFEAPNSDLCLEEPCVDEAQLQVQKKNQRVMFVYDQDEGAEDLYVNEYNNMSALRLYGENGYSAAFPYTDPEAPFDPLNPEAPVKDFVTLPPALIKAGIVVDQVDSKEKVFMRQWFVPELPEPVGKVWLEEPNIYVSEDVVSEYTYMFVDKHFNPTEGSTRSPTGALWTKFWLPVADNDDNQIGLDGYDVNGDGIDDMVNLLRIRDDIRNPCGPKDIAIGSDTYQLQVGDELQFLDHKVIVKDVSVISNDPAISLVVDVYYTGNDVPELIYQNFMATILPGEFLSAGRHTVIKDAPTFTEPWFMEAVASNTDDNVYLRVGRLLHTGETFFVDAAEYDIPMIFGSDNQSVKYITIRNPVPEHYDVNLEDLSVIKLSVDDNEIVPVLPPFNKVHNMIDDIDVPEYANHYTTCYYDDYSNVGDRVIEDVAPLEIFFTGKDIEPRFHTNLLEILDEPCRLGDESATSFDMLETWKWLHIRTMPDFYKEFVYPDLPNVPGGTHDYLVTLSWTAPNSDFCDSSIMGDQRLMFGHDPLDGTGLYMNQDEVCGTVVVKGDFNGDDIVDFMDFLDFVDAYDSAEGDENYDAVADFNDDGVVDFMDFLDFVDAYNA